MPARRSCKRKNVLKIVDDLKSLGHITNFTDTRVMHFPVCSQDTAWCSIRISFMINSPGSEAVVSNPNDGFVESVHPCNI